MTFQEKCKTLFEIRQTIGLAEKELADKLIPLKEQRDALQMEVMEEMKSSGQFSSRFDFATITRAVRKSVQVIDESKVIAWLKKKKLAKEYTQVRLADHFSALQKEMAKTGQLADGCELRETEYISISLPSKEDVRKVTVE